MMLVNKASPLEHVQQQQIVSGAGPGLEFTLCFKQGRAKFYGNNQEQ